MTADTASSSSGAGRVAGREYVRGGGSIVTGAWGTPFAFEQQQKTKTELNNIIKKEEGSDIDQNALVTSEGVSSSNKRKRSKKASAAKIKAEPAEDTNAIKPNIPRKRVRTTKKTQTLTAADQGKLEAADNIVTGSLQMGTFPEADKENAVVKSTAPRKSRAKTTAGGKVTKSRSQGAKAILSKEKSDELMDTVMRSSETLKPSPDLPRRGESPNSSPPRLNEGLMKSE